MKTIALVTGLAVLFPAAVYAEATPETLTVVTLNLWHDQHDWPSRLAVILPVLRELRPDVICLQEVLQHAGLRNQAETLADSLGAVAYFASVDPVGAPKRYGNAILTRHPVLHTDGRNLEPLNDYRTAAHVRIDFAGRPIDVYDTHLHHTPEGGPIRATQVRDLLAFIDSTRAQGPLVLAGDFNAELDTPELRLLAPAFEDAYRVLHPSAGRDEARTYNPIFGTAPGSIDHVFVARSAGARLEPLRCDVIFRTPGPDSVWASDHFGLMARLGVGGRAKRAEREGH
jgi:endonuclease/exonuclease/phosphatase family metal-dependent hydrolase